MTSPCIKPSLKPQIIELLEKHGPMTTLKLTNMLSCSRSSAGLVLRSNPEFYVESWTENSQQIWALGNKPHAPRPPRKAKPKESAAVVAARKARVAAHDHQRLRENYIKSVRLPWELTPCHP